MRLNVIFREENETIKLSSRSLNEAIDVGFGELQTLSGSIDYNWLKNKPSINSVVLEGALTAEELGLGRVYYDTKENWDAQSDLIAEKSVVYIYSNAYELEDQAGNRIPIAGLKIGDGTSFLIDMPFLGDQTTAVIVSHVANTNIHVTPQEKAFWNNKVSAYINHEDAESLVLSKTTYELDGEIIEG